MLTKQILIWVNFVLGSLRPMGRVAFEVGHELAANFGMNGRSVKKVGYKFAISLGIYT